MSAPKNPAPDDDGYLMSFEDTADRVPVLWIHGYPLSNLLWDYQVDGLADIARQITPDLRGHGSSDAPEPPFTMAQYANDCVRLLDHLGLTDPVVVGGLSMGGYIALELCRSHPERVAGLILAATRAGAESAEGRAARDKAAGVAIAEGIGAVAEGMLPKLMAPGTYEAEPELVEFVRDMMLDASEDGVVGALAAMRDRPDSTALLARIAIPTLVIHGEDDQLIPVAEAKAMQAAIKGAELVIIPGAGHLPCLEQPEVFNEAVRVFLEQFYEE
jgi:pimeloyl-ACP methyl ester carboxylesterase